jgi:hypothetical protein
MNTQEAVKSLQEYVNIPVAELSPSYYAGFCFRRSRP